MGEGRKKKLLVVQVAALGYELLRERRLAEMDGLTFQAAETVFPAVTCSVQASFRTAAAPACHGMGANGLFFRQLGRPLFWEQSARLIEGPRIWDEFRLHGRRVGMLFWQQSLGEDVDVLLSPAPIHKHHGGMIQDCYSKPQGLYGRLCKTLGRPFNLMHYWGPLASAKAGDWIAAATAAVMADSQVAPDLLLTYLPSLDYDLQRYGQHHARSRKALDRTLQQLRTLIAAAGRHGYEIVIFGDYAIGDCPLGAVFPNRALAQAGLMSTRPVRGMLYPDFHASRAFAVADHEIAHVYIRNAADIDAARDVLRQLQGIEQMLTRREQAALGVDHPNGGEMLLVAQEGRWLAYPWWQGGRQAPDYATHVDIHNKPGYDPCELFFGWPPPSTSLNTGRIRGSHGRAGGGRQVAWAASFPMPREVVGVLDLAGAVRDWLNGSHA